MPRALVTGGTGFLGANLADALERAGYDVRVLDVNPPVEHRAGQEYLEADVRDADAVRRAARGCDVVVDNAALVPVTRASSAEFRAVNVDGCRNTIAAARAEGGYLLHVSSSAIYGTPRSLPVTEDAPLAPFDSYGESKRIAERVVAAERSDDFPIASLRSRALLGRGRLGLFDVVFSRIRSGKRVPMFGRGDVKIQMCDAEDFCSAALAAIERRADGDFNVGAAKFGTVREDLEGLIERVSSDARLQPLPVWALRAVLGPLGWVGLSPLTQWHWSASSTSFWADITRARTELGWEPRYSNLDALARAYEEWERGSSRAGASGHNRPLGRALGRLLRG